MGLKEGPAFAAFASFARNFLVPADGGWLAKGSKGLKEGPAFAAFASFARNSLVAEGGGCLAKGSKGSKEGRAFATFASFARNSLVPAEGECLANCSVQKFCDRIRAYSTLVAAMNSDLKREMTGRAVLDAAYRVHSELGPGLLEIVYESALVTELTKHDFVLERQKQVPVYYDGQLLTEIGFRADLIVNSVVLVELKSVSQIADIHKKTVWNYLRLIPLSLGYLINFNEMHLKDGITRITNGAEGRAFFRGGSDVPERDTDVDA